MRVRRRRNCILRFRDERVLDFGQFFRGTMSFTTEVRCVLLCPLTGMSIAMDAADAALLQRVNAREWVDLESVSGRDAAVDSRLRELADRGILLSDPPSAAWSRLAELESEMDGAWWDDLASVYHAHACWRATSPRSPSNAPADEDSDSLSAMIGLRGAPPTHFPRRSPAAVRVELELPDSSDSLQKTLRSRRTTRAFRTGVALPLNSLEYALHTVFGVQGIRQVTEDIAAIRRTSPSAGAMHPIDAYALVTNVQSLSPGLYHYEADSHSLVLLEKMECDEARELALQFVAKQEYFACAHVLIIHVARFDRNFWKYPRDEKAYTTVMLDAGHLSQTMYLAATHLGLGVFFTSAINDGDIADRLGLHPAREAAIGVNGLGIADPDDDSLQFKTAPFTIDRVA